MSSFYSGANESSTDKFGDSSWHGYQNTEIFFQDQFSSQIPVLPFDNQFTCKHQSQAALERWTPDFTTRILRCQSPAQSAYWQPNFPASQHLRTGSPSETTSSSNYGNVYSPMTDRTEPDFVCFPDTLGFPSMIPHFDQTCMLRDIALPDSQPYLDGGLPCHNDTRPELRSQFLPSSADNVLERASRAEMGASREIQGIPDTLHQQSPTSEEVIQASDDSDTDFVPTKSQSNKAERSSRFTITSRKLGTKAQRSSTSGHIKRLSKSTTKGNIISMTTAWKNKNTSLNSTVVEARPFSCPLTPYGCNTTFTSKNEWKRHILSQHIRLGYWRCDLCPDVLSRPNDFNRKDLFTQHLRRMHSGSHDDGLCGDRFSKPSNTPKTTNNHNRGKDGGFLEATLESIRSRCWRQIREMPEKLACTICSMTFNGKAGFEDWLEHVGRHLATNKTESRNHINSDTQTSLGADHQIWQGDTLLQEWLIKERVIRSKSYGLYVLSDTPF